MQIFLISDVNDEANNKWMQITDSQLVDKLPEIIKKESDEVMDQTTTYLRSNIEKNEKITKNKIHLSELLNSPKYDAHAARNTHRYKNNELKNRPQHDRYTTAAQKINCNIYNNFSIIRLINIKTLPLYDTVDDYVKISSQPINERNFHKKETEPFDKDIYDPHLNIADKLQLINMINPKRPCERNRMNNQRSFHNRRKRNSDLNDQSTLTDDELDSALENFEYPGSVSAILSNEIKFIHPIFRIEISR